MAKKRNRITAAMSQTIADSSPLIKKSTSTIETDLTNTNYLEVPLNDLQQNPFQPRIDINMHSLNELISSIEQNGLLQPIIITEKQHNGKYTIVAGHRRYEAFKIIGTKQIPAIIKKDIIDKDLAILSLTENLLRENLHPIENAIAIKNILDNKIVESQNKLAEYVGLSKGYVSKLINILKLPTLIIKKIKEDNYKDINILILLNKLNSEEEMLRTYDEIKSMSRSDAEKYIKEKFSVKKNIVPSIIEYKNSKTKISINLNIKNLSEQQLQHLNNEVTTLIENIENLSTQWTN